MKKIFTFLIFLLRLINIGFIKKTYSITSDRVLPHLSSTEDTVILKKSNNNFIDRAIYRLKNNLTAKLYFNI